VKKVINTAPTIQSGYLIYHPNRARHRWGDTVVYADPKENGNQDPYIWNTRFLHTYCHMAQMTPRVGDACFWVTGDCWPDFNELYCDLVFVVQEQRYWSQANAINRDDPLVDSEQAWNDHYRWHHQHPYKKRCRFTLKAEPAKSFQPQLADGTLLDVVPFFTRVGVPTDTLHDRLPAGTGSQPARIDQFAQPLYDWITNQAVVRLTGALLEQLRIANPNLGSEQSGASATCC
jgi:hypothetical protein